MRNFITTLLFVSIASFSYSSEYFGEVVPYSDLMEVGVTRENIETATKIFNEATYKYKLLALEKEKLKIEINQLVLEDYEKSIEKIDEIFHRIGEIEGEILKSQFHSSLLIRKHITQEEYSKARMLGIERNKKKNIK